MTPTLSDSIAVVAQVVSAIATCFGSLGVVLLWQQIKETNKWNCVNTQHALVTLSLSYESERLVFETLERYGVGPTLTVPAGKYKEIRNKIGDWAVLRTFLNIHEQLCAAVNTQTLDEEYAYRVHNARVIFAYESLLNFIQEVRKERKNDTVYRELEDVAKRWRERTGVGKPAPSQRAPADQG